MMLRQPAVDALKTLSNNRHRLRNRKLRQISTHQPMSLSLRKVPISAVAVLVAATRLVNAAAAATLALVAETLPTVAPVTMMIAPQRVNAAVVSVALSTAAVEAAVVAPQSTALPDASTATKLLVTTFVTANVTGATATASATPVAVVKAFVAIAAAHAVATVSVLTAEAATALVCVVVVVVVAAAAIPDLAIAMIAPAVFSTPEMGSIAVTAVTVVTAAAIAMVRSAAVDRALRVNILIEMALNVFKMLYFFKLLIISTECIKISRVLVFDLCIHSNQFCPMCVDDWSSNIRGSNRCVGFGGRVGATEVESCLSSQDDRGNDSEDVWGGPVKEAKDACKHSVGLAQQSEANCDDPPKTPIDNAVKCVPESACSTPSFLPSPLPDSSVEQSSGDAVTISIEQHSEAQPAKSQTPICDVLLPPVKPIVIEVCLRNCDYFKLCVVNLVILC